MAVEPNKSPSYLPFTREAANYFMDFLETNFHKRRLPKRSISSRNSQNLLVGLSLKKYQGFCRHLWRELDERTGQLSRIISPGQFTSPIPSQTLLLIEQQANLIEDSQIEKMHERLISLASRHAAAHTDNVEQTVENAAIDSSDLIRRDLVHPFVEQIEAPLLSLSRNDIEAVLDAENTLTEIIYSEIHDGIADAVRNLILDQEYDLHAHLRSFCSKQGCQKAIREYFSEFSVSDLAFDLQELADNNRILDKQELYLYIGEIAFEKIRYPIIYTPVRIDKTSSGFSLTADSPFFINKKAISYISQQFNTQTGRHGGQELVSDRILYPAEFDGTVSAKFQEIVDGIADYFELTSHLDLCEIPSKRVQGFFVSITSDLRFAIFDKSDESLINDYEEILSLIDQEAPITEAFADLIKNFLTKDPPSFVSDTENIWHDTAMPERVAFSSPVPLNAEQRRILIALNNPKCRFLAVEGPPGTGKSHTITAIVCNAVLKGRSVLILSDKTEALNVVEDKITETLNSVRVPEKFQNPILRLGKSGNTYGQILSAPALQNIRDHYRTARNKSEQINTQRQTIESELRGGISATVDALSDIRLSKIQELYELESNTNDQDELVNFSELTSCENVPKILEIRRASIRLAESLESADFRHIHKRAGGEKQTTDSVPLILKLLHTINTKRQECADSVNCLRLFSTFTQSAADHLQKVMSDYNELTSGFFRHLFKKSKIYQLNNTIQNQCKLTS
ncbi:MAG: hypothetical protein IH825_07930, partial [Candidatus Marinimicrobia bacterium]|nr:hypothetical protein [Candidatus Neomarinimicrobiota bacterium]